MMGRRQSLYLRMRDGARVAVDVHLPSVLPQGGVPSVYRATRYGRSMRAVPWLAPLLSARTLDPVNAVLREAFVDNGYAWVDVDVRGSGASSGVWDHPWSPDEVDDGVEVLSWMARQTWSSGRIGAMGNSYDGTAGEFVATRGFPALRAVICRCSLFDTYTDIAYPGGVPLAYFTRAWNAVNQALDANAPEHAVAEMLAGAYAFADAPIVRRGLASVLRRFVRGVRPVDDDHREEGLRAHVGEHANNFDVHAAASDVTFRDDEGRSATAVATLERFSPSAYASSLESAKIPFLSLSGWRDGAYAHSAIKRHLALTHPDNLLVLGPWNHGGTRNMSPYARREDDADGFDMVREFLAFFDRHVRGVPDRSAPARVRYYTNGVERWRSTTSWPPPSAHSRVLHLAEGGQLVPAPAGVAGRARVVFDPAIGTGRRSRWRSLASAYVRSDYPDRRARDRKLVVFDSPPLESSWEITGHPVFECTLTVDGTDGALFVYLEDVAPSGEVAYVTEGQLRLLHRRLDVAGAMTFSSPAQRHSYRREHGELMTPGVAARAVIDLLPVSHRFGRGHRVRVALAAGDCDHFARVGDATTYDVVLGGSEGARVTVPVVE